MRTDRQTDRHTQARTNRLLITIPVYMVAVT